MTTTFHRLRATALSVSVALAMIPLTGLAQQVPSPTSPAGAAGDPPDRVARLNYFAGTVTLEPAGLSDWSYAVLNRPLTTGDQLWADAHARAELHAGSTALRLDQQTAVDIVNLNDTITQLKVTQGTLSAHVRALPAGQSFEIDTPNVALVATTPGLFRVDVAADGSATTVTLRAGNATLYGDGGSFQMSAGQQIEFVGSSLQQQAGGAAPGADAFDQWVASRDRAEDNSVSARYVSREIPGYEDLDANGTWRSNPTYGEVWVPTVAAAGWAPYHEGHWAWIAPWGWTWVDDAPWGFAPFHYGRWAYLDHAWAWVPGPVVAARPPVYAPALVAFVGNGNGGAHWGVDLAIGGAVGAGVAWFALGPGEAWHPAYHYSPAYYSRINNVNITNVHNTTIINNVTNIHNTYINQGAPGAITAVPANTFVRGQSVAQAARPFNAQMLTHAQIGAGAPAIAPVQQSFAGSMRPANVGAPAALAQREVVATRAPIVPAAFHDTLAQRFAAGDGKVPGAGEPVVRTAAPASFAMVQHPRTPGVIAAPAGFRVINRAQVHPVSAQGVPGHGAEVRAGQPSAPPQPQARTQETPNVPTSAAPKPQTAEVARANEAHENGVPHPQETGEHGQPMQRVAETSAHAPATQGQPEGHAPVAEAHAPAPEPAREAMQKDVAPKAEKPAGEEAIEKPHAQEAAAPRPESHPPQQHAEPHPAAHPIEHAHPQPHPEPQHKPENEHKDEHPH